MYGDDNKITVTNISQKCKHFIETVSNKADSNVKFTDLKLDRRCLKEFTKGDQTYTVAIFNIKGC